jgi:hypothetical protein
MIRVDRACDLTLTFTFGGFSAVRLSTHGAVVATGSGSTVSFTVPAANLAPGINVIELESLLTPYSPVQLASVDLAWACAAAP